MSLPQLLAGCVVLVTADRRAGDLRAALERRGARVVHTPALTIVPHTADEELVRETHALLESPPDTLVVTTAIGFRGWIEAADAVGRGDDLHAVLAQSRIIARGPKARGAIQAAGLEADWVAESETSAEIRDFLLTEGVAGQRIAVQHHGAGADELDVDLAAAGAEVTSLVVYRWGPPPDPDAVACGVDQAAAGDIDVVVFTSAPAASAWLAAADAAGVLPSVVARAASGRLVVAAVGSVTARPLRHAGILPLLPERSRLGSLVRAIVAHYEGSMATAVETVAGPLQLRSTAAVLDGTVLAVSPSGLAVLHLLTEAKGDVVSRSEVLEVLPGDSSDGHAVDVAVGRLREAIGDRRVVETVVKRGYRIGLA
mgnify:CR=1 FL=1